MVSHLVSKAAYLPGGKEKSAGASDIVQYAAGESAKFDVKTDLLEVVKDMRKRNVPTFAAVTTAASWTHCNDAFASEQ